VPQDALLLHNTTYFVRCVKLSSYKIGSCHSNVVADSSYEMLHCVPLFFPSEVCTVCLDTYCMSLLATMVLHVWASGQVGYNNDKLEGSDRRHMSDNIMTIHLPFNLFHFRHPVTECCLELVTL